MLAGAAASMKLMENPVIDHTAAVNLRVAPGLNDPLLHSSGT